MYKNQCYRYNIAIQYGLDLNMPLLSLAEIICGPLRTTRYISCGDFEFCHPSQNMTNKQTHLVTKIQVVTPVLNNSKCKVTFYI